MTGTGHTSTESTPVHSVPAADSITQPGPLRTGQPVSRAAIDAGVEEIRKRYGADTCFLFPRLEDRLARWVGLAPKSFGAVTLAGLISIGVRLGVAIVATALAGQWAEIPWGRWVPVLAFWGIFEATQPWRTPPLDVPMGPTVKQMLDDMTPLLPAMVRESDVRDLATFMRRWDRLPIAAGVGVTVATLILWSGWRFTPSAWNELPAGSIILLAFLLYDFGSVMVFGGLVEWAFRVRQARYEYHLFWPSPADSPEVRMAMQMWNLRALVFWTTVVLAFTVVLVSWDSSVVITLAIGFIVIGYLVTLTAAFALRSSVRKIIERSRQQRLTVLRNRIDAFDARFADLSPEESERLRSLLSLHNTIRDAPASFTATHTVTRALSKLVLPTIVFIITVFGEVSAERFLDAILP